MKKLLRPRCAVLVCCFDFFHRQNSVSLLIFFYLVSLNWHILRFSFFSDFHPFPSLRIAVKHARKELAFVFVCFFPSCWHGKKDLQKLIPRPWTTLVTLVVWDRPFLVFTRILLIFALAFALNRKNLHATTYQLRILLFFDSLIKLKKNNDNRMGP